MDKRQFEEFLLLSAIAASLSLFRISPHVAPHAPQRGSVMTVASFR